MPTSFNWAREHAKLFTAQARRAREEASDVEARAIGELDEFLMAAEYIMSEAITT